MGLHWKKCKTKLRPYGSKPLKVHGKSRSIIAFKDKSTISDIFVVKENLETLLSGRTAETLGIISFHTTNTLTELPETNKSPTINPRIDIFKGIGKYKNKEITLNLKANAKPVIQPIRPIPYHLKEKFDATVDEMVKQGIYDEHSGYLAIQPSYNTQRRQQHSHYYRL